MRHPRLVIGIIMAVIAVLAVGYVGAAVVVYDQVSRVDADCGGRFEGDTPAAWSPPSWAQATFDPVPYFVADYEDVRLAGRDQGIDLHAWWLPAPESEDAPVVVVVHGLGSCVRDREVLAPAGMLHRHGYGVLLLDLRDHGASSIEDGRMAGGTEEYRDVMAAVDWFVEQGTEPERIGVLGVSMGATTAIIAAGQDERITATWSDTAYADVERRVAEELEARGFPQPLASALAPATTFAARIVSGDDLSSHTALSEVANLAGRRLFIVHGAQDERTYVAHADDLVEAAQAAGVEADDWIVPSAGHVAAMFLYSAEYEERLAGFFEEALAG